MPCRVKARIGDMGSHSSADARATCDTRHMQAHGLPTPTTSWTLDELLGELASHDHVNGVMLLGSTGTAVFTPTSDYDVLLVFSVLPAPLRIVNTWIDGRLAEIYCTTTAAIERILRAPTLWPDTSEEATVLGWLKSSRVHFDRDGNLNRSQTRAAMVPTPELPGDHAIYEAWRKIGYNLAQVKRYLVADDPVSQTVIELRLLYSVDEVKAHYFTVRRLGWRGEKPAIRYWTDHDPDFLAKLREYFAETDRRERVALYEELAQLALAPVADLWGFAETAISLGAAYGSGGTLDAPSPVQARDYWQDLLN